MSQRTGDLVARLEGEHLSAELTCYTRSRSDTRWHAHDRLHLTYVFAGGGDSLSRSSRTELRERIWCYPAGAPHRWIPRTLRSRSINIELSDAFLDGVGATGGDVLERLVAIPDLETRLTRIAREVHLGDRDSNASVMSELLDLCESQGTSSGAAPPPWVAQLEDYLRVHWCAPLSLGDLAEVAGVHPVTVSKSFRRHFGTTLGNYRRGLRIEHSLSQVTGGDRALAEIALDCGFADQSHFSRTFRQVLGVSPGELRRQLN